jgi:hypothetical protein
MSDEMYPDDADTAVLDHAELSEPDETFWRAYNHNLEFPIATVLSVFAHLLVVAGLIGVLLLINYRTKDKSPVKIELVDNGPDDIGRGNPNDGGERTPIADGSNVPNKADFEQLPNLQDLAVVKDRIRQDLALDPSLADIPIPDEKVAPLLTLATDLQDKLARVGKSKGDGGLGKPGPGGAGADSTRARSLRWVMRFNITSGREYLNQLGSLHAVVVIPVPPANKSAYVYRDLSGNGRGELMTESEWTQLAQKVQFCDYKRDVIDQVTKELRAPIQTPHAFWAFFPTELEVKLAQLEKAHNNKRSEEIEETVFQVVSRGGEYDMVVVRQTLKK